VDERRRVDPVLEELRDLLPPGTDVVAVPAGGTEGDVDPVPARAAEADCLAGLRAAWTRLFPNDGEPPGVELRWVRGTDGTSAWAEATAARPGTVTSTELDRTVRELGADGFTAGRRDRGAVTRVLAQTEAVAVEIQARPGDGVIAVRARSVAVPVIPNSAPP
jgi:hypothetical protein